MVIKGVQLGYMRGDTGNGRWEIGGKKMWEVGDWGLNNVGGGRWENDVGGGRLGYKKWEM